MVNMLPTENLKEFYRKGSDSYKKGQYSEAAALFKTLVIHNPMKKKYWFALASSLQANNDYKLALKAWAMTVILSENDPYPHYYAAQCYIQINDVNQANKALKQSRACLPDKNHPLSQKIKTFEEALCQKK